MPLTILILLSFYLLFKRRCFQYKFYFKILTLNSVYHHLRWQSAMIYDIIQVLPKTFSLNRAISLFQTNPKHHFHQLLLKNLSYCDRLVKNYLKYFNLLDYALPLLWVAFMNWILLIKKRFINFHLLYLLLRVIYWINCFHFKQDYYSSLIR